MKSICDKSWPKTNFFNYNQPVPLQAHLKISQNIFFQSQLAQKLNSTTRQKNLVDQLFLQRAYTYICE